MHTNVDTLTRTIAPLSPITGSQTKIKIIHMYEQTLVPGVFDKIQVKLWLRHCVFLTALIMFNIDNLIF